MCPHWLEPLCRALSYADARHLFPRLRRTEGEPRTAEHQALLHDVLRGIKDPAAPIEQLFADERWEPAAIEQLFADERWKPGFCTGPNMKSCWTLDSTSSNSVFLLKLNLNLRV